MRLSICLLFAVALVACGGSEERRLPLDGDQEVIDQDVADGGDSNDDDSDFGDGDDGDAADGNGDAGDSDGVDGDGDAGGDNGPPALGECSAASGNRPIVKPTAGTLVITEVLANAAGFGTDAAQEWFEILNTGATAFDLNGLDVKVGSVLNPITSTPCLEVPAGGYALFAHTTRAIDNGGLPTVSATFTQLLQNTNLELSILDGGSELDAIAVSAFDDGESKALDPDFNTTADNDDSARFCAGTATYGTTANKGTPKAANSQCPF